MQTNGCPAAPVVDNNATISTSTNESNRPAREEITRSNNRVITDLTMNPDAIQDKVNLIAREVRFPSNGTTLTPTTTSSLNDIVAIMQANPSLNMNINGYTDSQGNDVANQQLSANRARASYEYLINQGISPTRSAF